MIKSLFSRALSKWGKAFSVSKLESEVPYRPADKSAVDLLFKPVNEVALVRLAAAAGFELKQVSEDSFRTVLDDVVLRLSLHEQNTWLVVRAEFPVMQPQVAAGVPANQLSEDENDKVLHLLIDATNEWNANWFLPTACVDKVGSQWMIRLDATFFISEGVSVTQFKIILERAAARVRTAIKEIPGLVPPGF